MRTETYALYLAYHDPRVPWPAKVWTALVVGYALSPLDLIPDFVPILGYVDDLILVPLGILLALKMIPADVLRECRKKASDELEQKKPANWIAGGIVLTIWLLALVLVLLIAARTLGTWF